MEDVNNTQHVKHMPKQLDFPANKLITIVDLFLRNIHDLNLSRAKLANSVK